MALFDMVRKGGYVLDLKARSGDLEKEIGDSLKDRNIRFILPDGKDPEEGLGKVQKQDLADRSSIGNADTRQLLIHDLADGRIACRFLDKMVQFVGQLGDNGMALSNFILWLVNQSVKILTTEARLADILIILNKAIDEMPPIDTTRHQAKTVTAGNSWP